MDRFPLNLERLCNGCGRRVDVLEKKHPKWLEGNFKLPNTITENQNQTNVDPQPGTSRGRLRVDFSKEKSPVKKNSRYSNISHLF